MDLTEACVSVCCMGASVCMCLSMRGCMCVCAHVCMYNYQQYHFVYVFLWYTYVLSHYV